jgi:hypothetical protein
VYTRGSIAVVKGVHATLMCVLLAAAIGSACSGRSEPRAARETPLPLRGTALPPRPAPPSGYFTYQTILTRFLTDRGTFVERPIEIGPATVSYRGTLVKLNGCTLLVDVEQRNVDERVQSAQQRVQGARRTSYSIPLGAVDPASIRISGVEDAAGRWVTFSAVDGDNPFEVTYGTRSGADVVLTKRVDLRVQDEESAVHIGYAFADAARECGKGAP